MKYEYVCEDELEALAVRASELGDLELERLADDALAGNLEAQRRCAAVVEHWDEDAEQCASRERFRESHERAATVEEVDALRRIHAIDPVRRVCASDPVRP